MTICGCPSCGFAEYGGHREAPRWGLFAQQADGTWTLAPGSETYSREALARALDAAERAIAFSGAPTKRAEVRRIAPAAPSDPSAEAYERRISDLVTTIATQDEAIAELRTALRDQIANVPVSHDPSTGPGC